MTAALELQGITKSYDTLQVLQKINLTVEEGEFICLLGPSGCGKTTLLRIIAGLLDPTDGDIVIRGRKVTALSPSERNIAMVFQSYALYPHKTVWENIAFPLRMRAPASTKIPFLGRFLPAGKKLTAELSRQVCRKLLRWSDFKNSSHAAPRNSLAAKSSVLRLPALSYEIRRYF